MQYCKYQSWYQVIRITGPTHNLLGLQFDDSDGEPEVSVEEEVLDVENATDEIRLEDIREEVLRGVLEANCQLGTSHRVTRIRYVRSDSPPVSVYRMLARSIVERLAKSGEFVGND